METNNYMVKIISIINKNEDEDGKEEVLTKINKLPFSKKDIDRLEKLSVKVIENNITESENQEIVAYLKILKEEWYGSRDIAVSIYFGTFLQVKSMNDTCDIIMKESFGELIFDKKYIKKVNNRILELKRQGYTVWLDNEESEYLIVFTDGSILKFEDFIDMEEYNVEFEKAIIAGGDFDGWGYPELNPKNNL